MQDRTALVCSLAFVLLLVLGCGGKKKKGTLCQSGDDCPSGGCFQGQCVDICTKVCGAGQICVRSFSGDEQCVSESLVSRKKGAEDASSDDVGREDSGGGLDLGTEEVGVDQIIGQEDGNSLDTNAPSDIVAADVIDLDVALDAAPGDVGGDLSGADVIAFDTLVDPDVKVGTGPADCPPNAEWPVGVLYPFEVNYYGPIPTNHTVEVSGVDPHALSNKAIVKSPNYAMLSVFSPINTLGPALVTWTIKDDDNAGAIVATVSCPVTVVSKMTTRVLCQPLAYSEGNFSLCGPPSGRIDLYYLGEPTGRTPTFEFRPEVVSGRSAPPLSFQPTPSLGFAPQVDPLPRYTPGIARIDSTPATTLCTPGQLYTIRFKVSKVALGSQAVLEVDERECVVPCVSCD